MFRLLLLLVTSLVSQTLLADTLVVLNKSEATASLIDVGKGKTIATLKTGDGPHEVDITSDGKYALVTNYGTRAAAGSSLLLVDIQQAAPVRTIQLGEYRRPHGVKWLRDNQRALVTAEDQKALLLVDTQSGSIQKTLTTGQEVSHMVAITPDEKRAYVANIGSGTITAIDLQKFTVLQNVKTGAGAEGIAVSQDGKEVWVTNREADTISVLNANSLETLLTIPSASFPIRAKMSDDGKTVLVSHANSGQLAVFDRASKKEIARLTFTAESVNAKGRIFGDRSGPVPVGIAIDPSGKTAFVAMSNADRVAVIDTGTWKVTQTFQAGKEPDGIGYSKMAIAPK